MNSLAFWVLLQHWTEPVLHWLVAAGAAEATARRAENAIARVERENILNERRLFWAD
jgi:hypothetical protein